MKLSVLHSCVMSSLTYSCETWADVLPQEIESIFRMGLKTALSIRFNTCNEITYIESGMYPASYGIKKRQMKFWSNLEESLSGNSHLNILIKKAKEMRLPYVMYYMNLQAKYGSAKNCKNTLQREFLSHIQQNIKESYDIDNNSTLGTYYQVNPDLQNLHRRCI